MEGVKGRVERGDGCGRGWVSEGPWRGWREGAVPVWLLKEMQGSLWQHLVLCYYVWNWRTSVSALQ